MKSKGQILRERYLDQETLELNNISGMMTELKTKSRKEKLKNIDRLIQSVKHQDFSKWKTI